MLNMTQAQKRFRRIFSAAALCAVFSAVCGVSCKKAGALVVDGNSAAGKQPAVEEAQIHFFFDRTESMRGFTVTGDNSEYVAALPALWSAADVFTKMDAHFYEYGETYISKFKNAEYIKRAALRPSFYGGNAVTNDDVRTKVKDVTSGQPFTSVAAYTKKLEKPGDLFVIVTDLYEQNRDDPFSRFYRDAFARGLSGAFFAVESSFSGTIHSVSRVHTDETKIPVRNGKSTFFICIAGDSGVVSPYCAALAKELVAQKLSFDSTVFIVTPAGEEGTISGKEPLFFAGEPALGGPRFFGQSENTIKRVNILPQQITVLGETKTSYQAYQIRNDNSRWAAGLPIPPANANPKSFVYKPELIFSFSEGSSGKRSEQNAPTQFSGISGQVNISAKVTHIAEIPETAGWDAKYPLYLVIETKNHNLSQGWHKIEYEVIPEAIPVPDWISALNADNISALEESAYANGAGSGARVKTLQLANVYEKIAEAYNKTKPRSIYKDELYLVKK
ncbi:MAG: hypothetical protein Pg6A_03620 [Termitinemataceae bacterium]|nr:MAG: hypothetical protein Pg6A_03620 [Termitinemataceae bacterium]